MVLIWLFRVSVVVCLTQCVACKPSHPGLEGQRPTALTSEEIAAVRTRAEAGEPEAQVRLGKLHLGGGIVPQSYDEAAKWFSLAAKQGSVDAHALLGELCEAGQGVPKDVRTAIEHYRAAATNGHAGAQYNLAFIYEAGRGVPQDQAEAVKWFHKAAEQGEPLSQYDLGQRYLIGVGVAKDIVEAYKWLALAAAQGQADASAKVADVKRGMKPQELVQAERRIAELKAKLSSQVK